CAGGRRLRRSRAHRAHAPRRGRRRRIWRAGRGATLGEPSQPLGARHGPAHAPVHASILRALGESELRRQTRARRRGGFLDQRKSLLPLLLRAARPGRAEGRGDGHERPQIRDRRRGAAQCEPGAGPAGALVSAARRSASSPRPGPACSASRAPGFAAGRGTVRRARRRGSGSVRRWRLPRNHRRSISGQSRRSRRRTCRRTPACPRSSACTRGRTRPGPKSDSHYSRSLPSPRARAPMQARNAYLQARNAYLMLARALAVFAAVVIASTGHAAPYPEPVDLGQGVYVFVGAREEASPANGGHVANQGFIVAAEGVIVIDSGLSAGFAEHMLRSIRARTGKPLALVVLTWPTDEAIFGAAVL